MCLDYYEILEKSNIFDIFIIDIIIDNTIKYKKIPIEFINTLSSLETLMIRNDLSKDEKYDILENFPFSSENKRMGILVRNTLTNKMTFYLKGADVIMKSKV